MGLPASASSHNGPLPSPNSHAGALPRNVVVPLKPPPNVDVVNSCGGATAAQSVGAGSSSPAMGEGRTLVGVLWAVASRGTTVADADALEPAEHPASAETGTTTSSRRDQIEPRSPRARR